MTTDLLLRIFDSHASRRKEDWTTKIGNIIKRNLAKIPSHQKNTRKSSEHVMILLASMKQQHKRSQTYFNGRATTTAAAANDWPEVFEAHGCCGSAQKRNDRQQRRKGSWPEKRQKCKQKRQGPSKRHQPKRSNKGSETTKDPKGMRRCMIAREHNEKDEEHEARFENTSCRVRINEM